MIYHPVSRIDIVYLCTIFDDIRLNRSSDMIGAPKNFNGSYDAPIKDGLSSVGCDFHIHPVHQIWTLCDHQLRRCIRQLRRCIRQRKM